MVASIELTVDQSRIVALAKMLKAEVGSTRLRRELIVDLRAAVAPGIRAVQGKLRAIPHASAVESSPSLGAYLASRVRPQVRLSGRSAGVAVRIGQTPALRGFKMASRRLNRKAWRHKVYGNPRVWVTQQSPIPGYFDDTLADGKREYYAAVIRACRRYALRLGERF